MSPDGAVRIKDGQQLLQAIGLYLVTAKKTLSPKELRFLRRAMDDTQDSLAEVLGVSDQSVARWEKGRVEIPSPADFLIRMLYLEFIGEKQDLRDLLKSLRETDEPMHEKHVFTKDGDWRLAECA
jgi:DNA-binding transcriptional regulator YiaG